MKIFDNLKNIFHAAASDLTAAHTSGLDLTLPRARRLSTASLAASTTLPLPPVARTAASLRSSSRFLATRDLSSRIRPSSASDTAGAASKVRAGGGAGAGVVAASSRMAASCRARAIFCRTRESNSALRPASGGPGAGAGGWGEGTAARGWGSGCGAGTLICCSCG